MLHHPAERAFFQTLADHLWREACGRASRVARLHAMADPPSIIEPMVIDMNEAQIRSLEQAPQVLAGTWELEFRPATDDKGRYA